MAITWGTIRSLLLFFGPLLIPKALGYYRSLRTPRRGPDTPPIRPVPPAVSRALLVLLAAAVVFFLKTLPVLSPENVFVATQSRLQAPVDVLFRRLASLRPGGVLSAGDEALRARLVSVEGRLLYLQFGPAVVAGCPFCEPDDPSSWFYYAVPGLLLPHVLNLMLLAAVTSSLVSGRDGLRWRTLATMAACAACLVDLAVVNSHGNAANAKATRLAELDHFFWRTRVYRYTALAALDGVLGWVMYLSSTNRAFVRPPSPAERVEAAVRTLTAAKGKLNAVGIVKNTALRDDDLRKRGHAYWAREVQLMGEVMEEREVIESVNNALESRLNVQAIARDAEEYSRGLLAPLQGRLAGDGTWP